MTSIHEALSQLLGEPQPVIHAPFPDPEETIAWFLYGAEEPLVALGTTPEGHNVLGFPRLIWYSQIPSWSMEPTWTVPPEWDALLTSEQCAELTARALAIAAARKAEYLTCCSCGELKMPEWVDPDFGGQPTCHACMEQQGVVF